MLINDLQKANIEAMKAGICNLKKHAENMTNYGVPVVISANRFPSDTDAEIKELKNWCISNGYRFALNEGALKGSEGAVELANAVKDVLDNEKANFTPLYPLNDDNYSSRNKNEMLYKKEKKKWNPNMKYVFILLILKQTKVEKIIWNLIIENGKEIAGPKN